MHTPDPTRHPMTPLWYTNPEAYITHEREHNLALEAQAHAQGDYALEALINLYNVLTGRLATFDMNVRVFPNVPDRKSVV